jgi:hypothetical protein
MHRQSQATKPLNSLANIAVFSERASENRTDCTSIPLRLTPKNGTEISEFNARNPDAAGHPNRYRHIVAHDT